jgi:hypothetical protein
MNYESKEFFKNIKSIPTETSSEYDAFFEEERRKITYGVTINGVYIHGWLYWHLNHWHIYTDAVDEIDNSIKRIFVRPYARDNEWIIQEALLQAEKERKGIMLFGVRRFGKTEFEASYIGRSATMNKGSQNLITGGNWVDIDLITTPLTGGLDSLHPYFVAGRISENPRKDIVLGFKNKSGKKNPWSIIAMRNYEDGNNTEAAAGVTPSAFVIDEVGKFNFSQCLAAAKPSFTSPFGWRCVPILTGTSGYIKANSDAERYFSNPEANNFISRILKEEGNKKVSVFISGLRRMEGKVKTTFGKFIEKESGILIPENSELHEIDFFDSDFNLAENIIDEERRLAALSPDPIELLKATMYYPKNTKELFLTDTGNNFPLEAIKATIEYLEANPALQGTPCRLYRDAGDGKVRISYNTDKQALNIFPLEKKDEILKDAAIIIYEEPILNPPPYLYLSGADPYAESDSDTSDSLGSVYIYKRLYDPLTTTYQRRIVAEYTGRPKTLKEWHTNVEMLLELYNAVCLPENNTGTFIQYFDSKDKGYMLADAYDFLKEISPKTSIKSTRAKGLPATPGVQKYYKELIFHYLTEELTLASKEDGTPITQLGVIRIPSIGLLRELLSYNKEGNFDRYVAFGHTLAHEVWADKIYPFVKMRPAEPEKQENRPPTIQSPFGPISQQSSRKLVNPFGL